MRFRFLASTLAAFTVSLCIAVPGMAQSPAPQPAGVAAFSPDAFRGHVAFLADDLLEGREAGSRGYDIASRYVATQFEALGLRPAVGESWYQPVALARQSLAGSPTLTVGDRVFRHGEAIVFRASGDAGSIALEAPLVFVGYGLDLPDQGYDDYAGLDVRGAIAVVIDGTPEGIPSDVAAHLDSEKNRMAAGRGALGTITIRTRAEAERRPWAQMLPYGLRPATTWVDREGRPFAASGLRFVLYADQPAAEALFAGAPTSLSAVLDEAARPGIRPRGFALPSTARVARESAGDHFASQNVLALLPGSDPTVADEVVLLMAHLDGLGIAEQGDGDRIRNGAMDNATGVATLIEVARQMMRPGNRPRRSILFAAVTAEEKGLLGADFLARHPVGRGRVVSVVNLDMPVLTYDFRDVTAFGAEHSTLGPIVARAAARMGVAVAPDPLPEEGLFTRSDHYRFVQQGVPSVFLMTGFANGGRERFTAFLADQYHSPRDDMAQPMDWNAGARFAQLNYLIAREIADGAQAPLWYEGSFFGDMFGGDRPRAPRPSP